MNMKRLAGFLLFSIMLTGTALSQESPVMVGDISVSGDDYRIYRSDGTPSSLAEIRAALGDYDVVFVGELHNDPVSHAIEQEVLRGWYAAHGSAAALSMEMFARDVQYIVDEYLGGFITEAHFQQASSPWSNYETDYKPLVEFARENDLAVIAANAPRRYANMVTRFGRPALGMLSDQAKSFVAPLPYGSASARYTEQWNAVMAEAMASMTAEMEEANPAPEGEMDHAAMHEAHHGEGSEMEHGEMEHGEGEMDHAAMQEAHHGEGSEMEHGDMEHGEMEHGAGKEMPDDADHQRATTAPAQPEHGGGSMLDAQSLWDATMAWSIAEHLTKRPGSKVAHMVGGFHSETGTGTPEHLLRYRPGTSILIVSVQSVEDPTTFDSEEHTGLGDFVVLGSASLPRTYETRER